MKVLVACEESQRVCTAFRLRGHEAYSCDLLECSGGHPEWHIKGDCLPILDGYCDFKTQDGGSHYINGEWDMIIAHPPCTFLSNAGARWLYSRGKINEERLKKGEAAKLFFEKILGAKCRKICIENPLPSKIFNLPPPSQIIQPYEYGEPYSKKTLLWLRGVDRLVPTQYVKDYIPYVTSYKYSTTHDAKYKGVSVRGEKISITRAKTFFGIAKAMAEQWG